ncbi:heptosyltransferase-2 [Balneicella halophila]|uniref:Heptosyltransferase-2 n=1 Tax=Balneicella halophila TaxID=1537566 RepID=A0A7L4URW0_BALHA|nr:glycosyltransferase family 9 protein [Balneicella halophila]PVX52232.1 heptosyltransferase-2 [Balneicella halophila]
MPKQIIMRTSNYIGDTIMMLPALELVQREYPDASITIVCKAKSRDIFRGKGIKDIIIDDTKGKGRFFRTLQFVRKLRKNKYDLGILFHNSFLTALLFRLAKVKTLIGYQKEGRKFLLDFSLPIDRSWHYSNHYANLVNIYWNSKYDYLPPMILEFKKTELFDKAGRPLVGFLLGEECAKAQNHKDSYAYRIKKGARRYPLNLGEKLFEYLSKEDIDFVLLGDSKDCKNHRIYTNLLKKNMKHVVDLTGKTSVGECIDAIGTLDLLVTIDTSAMHMAAATNTEFILLQGKGTSPLSVVFPIDGEGHVLNKGQHCLRGEDMISAIKPDDIYHKIMELLEKKSYL